MLHQFESLFQELCVGYVNDMAYPSGPYKCNLSLRAGDVGLGKDANVVLLLQPVKFVRTVLVVFL